MNPAGAALVWQRPGVGVADRRSGWTGEEAGTGPNAVLWKKEKQARLRAVVARDEAWNEQDLVARAQGGDRRALGQLLLHFGPRLYRNVLLPRLGDEARAKDALSTTYLRVIQNIHRYEPGAHGIYPWLRVIAARVALDDLRGSHREPPVDVEPLHRRVERDKQTAWSRDPETHPFEEHHDRNVVRARMHEALESMNPRYAMAIRLRILEERPRIEVAKQLGVTPATFDVILHRAVTSLKKTLRKGEAKES